MFFVLSKTLGIMLLPINFLIGARLAGRHPAGDAICRRSAASLLIDRRRAARANCGFSPLGNLLLYPLESRFPPWDAARGAPDGIIVLGGSIDADLSAAHGTPVVSQRGRPHHRGGGAGASLSRTRASSSPAAAPNLISNDAREADYAARDLREPRHREIAADHGTAVAQHAGERRILQGAGGAEARRALAAGDVGLITCRARSACSGKRDLLSKPIRSTGGSAGATISSGFTNVAADGLGRTDIAMREWMGLIAYRITGKTDELLPGPEAP